MPKPKITPSQWLEIDALLQKGESARDVAKRYGVSDTAIRKHFGPIKKDRVERTAKKIFEARVAKSELPAVLQVKAESLADKLEILSRVMAQSAELSSKTALRMAALANAQAQMIDDSEPSAEAVRAIHALTDTSNKAAYQGLELLKANKDMMTKAEEGEPVPVAPVYKIVNA
jgi:transposase